MALTNPANVSAMRRDNSSVANASSYIKRQPRPLSVGAKFTWASGMIAIKPVVKSVLEIVTKGRAGNALAKMEA